MLRSCEFLPRNVLAENSRVELPLAEQVSKSAGVRPRRTSHWIQPAIVVHRASPASGTPRTRVSRNPPHCTPCPPAVRWASTPDSVVVGGPSRGWRYGEQAAVSHGQAVCGHGPHRVWRVHKSTPRLTRRCRRGTVKLRHQADSDTQHVGPRRRLTTISCGSITPIFVNLTIPLDALRAEPESATEPTKPETVQ